MNSRSEALGRLRDALQDALAAVDAFLVDEPVIDQEQMAADWYVKRVKLLIESGRSASEGDDVHAAALAGIPLSRSTIRDLRRQFAPEPWTRAGRRRVKPLK